MVSNIIYSYKTYLLSLPSRQKAVFLLSPISASFLLPIIPFKSDLLQPHPDLTANTALLLLLWRVAEKNTNGNLKTARLLLSVLSRKCGLLTSSFLTFLAVFEQICLRFFIMHDDIAILLC